VQIAAERLEVEHRVADELPGAVVRWLGRRGLVADDGVGQVFQGAEAALIGGAADGVHGFVLKEEQFVGRFRVAILRATISSWRASASS